MGSFFKNIQLMLVSIKAAFLVLPIFDINAEKAHHVPFDKSYNSGAVDVKMDRSVLKKKSFYDAGIAFLT